MKSYTQLIREERYQIRALLKEGRTQVQVTKNLGRSPSTISRELRRNRGLKGYRPNQAQTLACNRRQGKVVRRIDAHT